MIDFWEKNPTLWSKRTQSVSSPPPNFRPLDACERIWLALAPGLMQHDICGVGGCSGG